MGKRCCRCGQNTPEPLYRGSEVIPASAVVLFDGTDLSQWVKAGTDEAPCWKVENGYMEVVPGTGNIASKQRFWNFQLHVEFWLPLMADCQGQARANSGVYLQGRYEIQVLDSYGLDAKTDDCGAFYKLAKPAVNSARPPEHWQTYDVYFLAPKFNEDGVKIANARASVLWNGIWIHHDVELPQATGGELDREYSQPGPIMLQDHGNLIRYRNVWVIPF